MNSRQRKAVQSAINAFDKARDWLVEAGDHEGLIEALDATIEDLEEELKMATAINGPSEAQSSGKASERHGGDVIKPASQPQTAREEGVGRGRNNSIHRM
jgi:hypothetical protein